jgi:hypothetical protein
MAPLSRQTTHEVKKLIFRPSCKFFHESSVGFKVPLAAINVVSILKITNVLGIAVAYYAFLIFGPGQVGAYVRSRQVGPLVFLAFVLSGLLYRKHLRDLVFVSMRRGRSSESAVKRAALLMPAIWLWVFPVWMAFGAAWGSVGLAFSLVAAMVSWAIGVLFGIGAPRREAERVLLQQHARQSVAARLTWGWTVFLAIAVGVAGLSMATAVSVDAKKIEHSALTNELKERRVKRAKETEEALDRGSVVDHRKRAQTWNEESERIVAALKEDPVLKAGSSAVVRVQKTLNLQAVALSDSINALNDAGGVFDAELLSLEKITERRRLVMDVRDQAYLYRARITNLRPLLAAELEAQNVPTKIRKPIIDLCMDRMQVGALLAFSELVDQSVDLHLAVLDLLEKSLGSRAVDELGRPLFFEDADVETYNGLIARSEKIEQSKETVFRRLLDIQQDRK